MNDVIAKLRHNELWTISVQLLVLYVVSVGCFLIIHEINLKITGSQRDAVAKGKVPSCLLVFVLALVSNALGVAGLDFLARQTGEAPRLAMVAVPFLLVLEKHIRHIRDTPKERRYNLLASAGVTLGMAGAVYALMRHAPLK